MATLTLESGISKLEVATWPRWQHRRSGRDRQLPPRGRFEILGENPCQSDSDWHEFLLRFQDVTFKPFFLVLFLPATANFLCFFLGGRTGRTDMDRRDGRTGRTNHGQTGRTDGTDGHGHSFSRCLFATANFLPFWADGRDGRTWTDGTDGRHAHRSVEASLLRTRGSGSRTAEGKVNQHT